ncbi:hypothetical protein GCM10009827_109550 [Dactylosporangium maewongense]|uniref:Secreted protein n=1 Tax=Dactylosporangium maewongense TaxID=634393 RepID=A0ABN2D659_9ACTN
MSRRSVIWFAVGVVAVIVGAVVAWQVVTDTGGGRVPISSARAGADSHDLLVMIQFASCDRVDKVQVTEEPQRVLLTAAEPDCCRIVSSA